MEKFKLLLALMFSSTQILFAQIPHLKGVVKISILEGTIESELEYSNLPSIANYSIWLNAGLNVKYFRNAEDNFTYSYGKEYNDDKSSEAFQYYLAAKDNKNKFLPDKFKINYVGKFPVINDTLKAGSRGDWKGNIAFNGKSIRATEQSAWYPILYDMESDIVIDKITYDISIACKDCKSIYLNGSAPINGDFANFKSDKAISMILFAGLFDFTKNNNTYFINTELSPSQESALAQWTGKITSFYENKLKIPYGNSITYLYTEPISKNNAWMFVTYPTIAIIGRERNNVKSYFYHNTNRLKDSSSIEYFAHELGHYYFGTVIVPNANLRWVFLEGLTEYLALQTVKEVLGEDNYQKKIASYLEETKDFEPTPLTIIKNSEINTTYRYNYIPLLITALEKQVGNEQTWKWLRIILSSEKLVKTDYTFFKSSLINSGIKESEFEKFEQNYIISKNAKANVFKTVK